MMPITEGCLAWTHGSFFPENNGVVVVVGRCLGSDSFVNGWPVKPSLCPLWEIDIKQRWRSGYVNIAPESQLLRIDGLKEETKEKEQELIV